MLKIRLLGGFRVEYDGVALTRWESFKVEALFVYLVLHPRETFRRPYLAGIFWPEKPERKALASLRHALHTLRRLLPPFEGYFHTDRIRVGFEPRRAYWLDVEEYARLIRQAEKAADGDEKLRALAQAVRLYRGSFLDGHPAHERDEWEWVSHVREGLEEMQLRALEQLAEGHAERAEHAQAAAYARQAVELQPYREELYRRLMEHLIAHGDFSEAARVYSACVQAIQEMGLSPGARTRELWEGIARRPPPKEVPAPLPQEPRLRPQRRRKPSESASIRPLTPLIGREREVARALALLGGAEEGGPGRLLTLVGPGGTGKTRLALEIAARLGRDCGDGVCFLSLEGVSDPSLLEDAVARSLSLPTHGPRDLRAQLLQSLRGKELLLVLDGFEHLISRADFPVELLQEAPRLRILVTSRERLHLPEERVLAVGGLATPRTAEEGVLEESPAAQLFLHHARRVAPDFVLADEDREYLRKICCFLEGLPLGIELAAAWSHLLRPKEIWEGLRRARVPDWTAPADASGDSPARRRSLRAVLEHSWSLLSPEERTALLRLAAFRGGFHREAAEWVAQSPPAVLAGLRDKSLIHRGPLGRLRLHELVRAFAEEKLASIPEEAERVAERHGLYYLRLLRRREEALRGTGTIEALEEIEAEVENVRAGWEWAVRRNRVKELASALDGLYLYCFLRGRFREGERACRQALRALRARSRLRGEEKLLLVRLTVRRGIFLERRTRYRSARRLLEYARKELAAMLASPRFQPPPMAARIRWEGALCLQRYAIVLHMMGEPEEGRKALREAQRWAQAAGDPWLLAHVLRDRAISAQARGDYSRAAEFAEESLRLFEKAGSDDGVATTSGTLSMVSMSLGEYEAARRWICRTLPYLRRADQRWMLGLSYLNLGEIHRLKGRLARAERCAQRARRIFEEADSPWGRVISALGLGEIALSRGKWEEAADRFRRAERLAAEAGLVPERVRALCCLSRLARERDGKDRDAARGYLRQAVELLKASGRKAPPQPNPLLAEVLVEVGFLWLREGRFSEASRLVGAVLAGFPLYARLRERAESLRTLLPPPPTDDGASAPGDRKRAPRAPTLLAWTSARLASAAKAEEVASGSGAG